MAKRRSTAPQGFDGMMMRCLNEIGAAFTPMDDVRPALQRRGMSEAEFDALVEKARESGNPAADEALSDIYQDAARLRKARGSK